LEKVRPEAAYKTCCLEEDIIARPNLVRKSMPGKVKLKIFRFCPEKQDGESAKPPSRWRPPGADLWADFVEACGKMDSDAPESTKNENCSVC
jgi:hypothetical protein